MSGRATRSSKARELAASGSSSESLKLSSSPSTPVPTSRRIPVNLRNQEDSTSKVVKHEPITPNSSRKRTRGPAKVGDGDELPHGLGSANGSVYADETQRGLRVSKKRRTRTGAKQSHNPSPLKDTEAPPAKATVEAEPDTRQMKKETQKMKAKNYGLTPGQTPFPDWPHPTAEECEEVIQLLSSVHGEVKVPENIPLPSLTVTGCGEVPSVLDALIRTRLSAATTSANSSRAFRGLVETFGVLKSGTGNGSVDWDAVRRADIKDIYKAIQSGGLASVKSKDIKAILQMVYEENQERRKSLIETKGARDLSKALAGAGNKLEDEHSTEMARADANVLSLDHLHTLPSDEAFEALLKYPGIGPKTASCVLLFCLQRPSFAVDTHVFRLCRWLGWVPQDRATRNSAYAHCEVRIPNHLKYPLHQLLIRHGRSCPRCKAATGSNSKDWASGCVIDHLVKRSGGRKDITTGKTTRKGGKVNNRKLWRQQEGNESSELSEQDSDAISSEAEGEQISEGD